MTRAVPRAVRHAAGALLAGLALTPAAGRAQAPGVPAVLAGARQLLVVSSDGWDDTTGTLRRYERPGVRGRWRPVGEAVPVVLGRTGLAWGMGQGAAPRGAPVKREGDGRSPAGAFPLLHAFSNVDMGFQDTAFPALQLSTDAVCVDDPRSALYNTVADGRTAASAPWTSAERMARVAGYRLGIVVGYNGARTQLGRDVLSTPGAPHPMPGRGSCIFLHVWDGPGRPTEGCTAMTEGALSGAIAWLDPRARPVLVQMPAGVLARVRARWALPRTP